MTSVSLSLLLVVMVGKRSWDVVSDGGSTKEISNFLALSSSWAVTWKLAVVS